MQTRIMKGIERVNAKGDPSSHLSSKLKEVLHTGASFKTSARCLAMTSCLMEACAYTVSRWGFFQPPCTLG